MVSDDDSKDGETFLPDLPDEISGEQLVLQQKVFRANEVFMKKHNNILKWLNSPEDCRIYPKEALKNKHAYKKKVSSYMYDKKKGILYKRIRNTDGIGEAFFCFPHSTRKNSIKVSFHRLCMFKYRKNSKISTWYRVYILKTETLFQREQSK